MLAFGVQISPKWRAEDARLVARKTHSEGPASAESPGPKVVSPGAAKRLARQYAKICEAVSRPAVPRDPEEIPPAVKPLVARIIREFAAAHGVTSQEIIGPRRSRIITTARHVAIQATKLIRPDLSMVQIGRAFGKRDHTTILHALRRKDISPDPEILARFGYIAGQADENMVQNETARDGAANTETGLTAPIKGADRHG